MAQLVRVQRSPSRTEDLPGFRRDAASAPGRAVPPSSSLHSVEHLAALQRTSGNQAVAALVGGLAVQRLVGKDDLWDHYNQAYWARMNVRNRPIDGLWTQRFFLFEERLYGAKGQESVLGPAVYDAVPVQEAHDRLYAQGLDAPGPAADPNVIAANTALTHAKTRWQAFRGNPGLNRGAWAGSNSHGGQPGDYVQTPAGVVEILRERQVLRGGTIGAWWLMASDSAPSRYALHRGGVDDRGDFIYHL